MTSNHVETAWRSPGLKVEEIDYVVCIPTFRRPGQLRDTLASLERQNYKGRFALVVAENHAESREGEAVAKEVLTQGPLQGLVLVEHAKGNCAAINAAFGAARAIFANARGFLMIDDDEIAEAGWLEGMVDAAESSDAEIVGGPVFPVFEDKSSRFTQHPAFEPAYGESGSVPLIYGSGNCLITRKAFEGLASPQFDMQFNLLGGGDTDFFTRCKRAGMKFYWAQDAVIRETVPCERTSFGWLRKRGLRTGALNYRIDRKWATAPTDRLKLVAKNIGALPVGAFRAVRALATYRDPLIAIYPMFMAAGRSLAAVGLEPHQYGN